MTLKAPNPGNTALDPPYQALIQELAPTYGEFTDRRLTAIERIRSRNPEDLAANAQRAMAAIGDSYLSQSAGNTLDVLHQKAKQFAEYFDTTVFAAVVHATQDLGEHVELKSPAILAHESGNDITQMGSNSNALDALMGNTDYVFGNSPHMPSYDLLSISAREGTQQYSLSYDETNTFVVPFDFVNFHELARPVDDDPLAVTLEQYASNIYKFSDFKTIFAAYNAAIFETPQAAIEFYNNFSSDFIFGSDGWQSLDSDSELDWPRAPRPESAKHVLRLMTADERGVALRMRELMWGLNPGIYPPLMPEFQIPHQVLAERLV